MYQDTRDALNGAQGRKNDTNKQWRVQVDGITVYSSFSKKSAAAKASTIRERSAHGREVEVV